MAAAKKKTAAKKKAVSKKKAPAKKKDIKIERLNENNKRIIEKARSTGLLPHEILLNAARGESFIIQQLVIIYHKDGPNKGQEKRREWNPLEYWPTFDEQIDAAKAAAPYYAPRLSSHKQTLGAGSDGKTGGVMLVPVTSSSDWGLAAEKAQDKLKKTVKE